MFHPANNLSPQAKDKKLKTNCIELWLATCEVRHHLISLGARVGGDLSVGGERRRDAVLVTTGTAAGAVAARVATVPLRFGQQHLRHTAEENGVKYFILFKKSKQEVFSLRSKNYCAIAWAAQGEFARKMICVNLPQSLPNQQESLDWSRLAFERHRIP